MKKTATGFLLIILAACGQREAATTTGTAAQPPNAATTTGEAEATEIAQVGKPMPAFTAQMLDGSTFDLAKERGNVVLLNLWATWCGPCRYEIPELEKLHKQHAAQRFKVVGVSVDEGGDQVVRDFVEEQKVSYPIALDPQSRLSMILETVILPTSVIVDRKGTVVWKKLGVVTTDDEEMIRALDAAFRS
ncbi:MAG TPA: TlpA disulfide reductase family protein [Thermoanaerobaculia bacterium]